MGIMGRKGGEGVAMRNMRASAPNPDASQFALICPLSTYLPIKYLGHLGTPTWQAMEPTGFINASRACMLLPVFCLVTYVLVSARPLA
ncbi:hypothetical protein LX36DRAFT_191293 [Colletotrichum falcatum]|nr:hypothetical protein LX36DRAFT_191293 [Colletotrichum falcatum]